MIDEDLEKIMQAWDEWCESSWREIIYLPVKLKMFTLENIVPLIDIIEIRKLTQHVFAKDLQIFCNGGFLKCFGSFEA